MKFVQSNIKLVKNNIEEWNVIKNKEKVGKISIKQIITFPNEWLLEFSESEISELESVVKFAKERIKLNNGKSIIFRIENLKQNEILTQKIVKLGFTHYYTTINSYLDLTSFNISEPKIKNITLESWLESSIGGDYLESTHDNWIQLYNLECRTSDDIPKRRGFKHPSFNKYLERFLSKKASLESLFIARDKERIIGLSYAWEENERESGIFFTGVDQSYRKKGIATALKIKLANYLKINGFTRLETNNKEINFSIISTNKKLGFKQYSEITLYSLKV